jgi:hypothetical protein
MKLTAMLEPMVNYVASSRHCEISEVQIEGQVMRRVSCHAMVFKNRGASPAQDRKQQVCRVLNSTAWRLSLRAVVFLG